MEKDKEQSVEMRTHVIWHSENVLCLKSHCDLCTLDMVELGGMRESSCLCWKSIWWVVSGSFSERTKKKWKRWESWSETQQPIRPNRKTLPDEPETAKQGPNKGQSCISRVKGWRGWSGSHLTALMTALRGAERSSRVTSQWQPRSSRESSVLMPASTERGR